MKKKINYQRMVGIFGLILTLALSTLFLGSLSIAADKQKVKIKVWTKNRPDANYMNEKIDKFNKENPDNIEIDYQIYSDNYMQVLDLAFATGEAPDLFIEGGGVYEKRLFAGELAPLNPFLTSAYKKRFGPGAFIKGINEDEEGNIYSFPAVATTTRLVYNKGIFKQVGISKAPRTLAEMVKDSKLISKKLAKKGIYGYAQNFKSPATALQRSVDFIAMRSGGVREGYDFKKGKYDFTSYKPILQAYKEIFSSNAAFPGCESLDIDPLRTQFAAGKIGMYISWTHAEPGVYTTQFPTKEDWSMAPVPTIDGTVKGSNRIADVGRWFMMSSKSKHPQEAWKVMQFLYSDDLLAGYHEKGFGLVMIPSVLKKAKDPETIKKWPAIKFDEHDKIWPSLPLGVRPEGKDMYQVMLEIIYGVTDLNKGIADLNDRYNNAYEKLIKEGKLKRIIYPQFDPADPGKVFD